MNRLDRAHRAFEQRLGHPVSLQLHRVLKRHAPRERHVVALVQADALVGIEAEVEEKIEDLRTIVGDRDARQSAGAVVLVG